MNQILCTPREAIKYRQHRTPAELDWAETISDFYTAHPIKGDATNFYTFVAEVFAAGRISGVREERARRKGAARHE